MKILAIAGSLRAGSSNVALVRVIAELAPPDVTVTIFNALGALPMFSPDIDNDEPPQAIADFRKQIEAADGILICTPEYAYGMPGSLKNALDWLVSSASLYRKSVAALSASPSPRGGDRALDWLLQTLMALEANVPKEASFSISIVREHINSAHINNTEIAIQIATMFRSLKATQ